MAQEIWRYQAGSVAADEVLAAVTGLDGGVVLAGWTRGTWNDPTVVLNDDGSEFAAVSLDANGSLLWQWQDGTPQEDQISAGTSFWDGSAVLAGHTAGDWAGTNAGEYDFAAIKLASDGTEMWRWQNGSSGGDEVFAMTKTTGGSFVLAGNTFGEFAAVYKGGYFDFAAVKIDRDGEEVWRWQDGTAEDDQWRAAATHTDDSVVLAGYTEGNWNLVVNTDIPGNTYFAAIKLDSDGMEVWRWQGGTEEADVFEAAVTGPDGSVIFAGWTSGDWNRTNIGAADFAAAKFDTEGNLLWKWQDGTAAQDYLYAASALENGSVLLVGSTGGKWDGLNAGGSDFAAVTLDADGTELWRWQNGSGNADVLNAATAGSDGAMILAGSTLGLWDGASAGGVASDFAAVMLNVSDIATPAPSPIPVDTTSSAGRTSPALLIWGVSSVLVALLFSTGKH